MVSYFGFSLTMFFLFFSFGSYKLITDDQISDDLKFRLADQIGEKPFKIAAFVRFLDDLSPTLSYKLPFTDRKIFLINEFPLTSYTQIVLASALLFIASLIMHYTNEPWYWRIGIFLFLIVFAYFAGSVISYVGYNMLGDDLGISKEERIELRINFSNNFENVMTPILILSSMTVITLGRLLFRSEKRASD